MKNQLVITGNNNDISELYILLFLMFSDLKINNLEFYDASPHTKDYKCLFIYLSGTVAPYIVEPKYLIVPPHAIPLTASEILDNPEILLNYLTLEQ